YSLEPVQQHALHGYTVIRNLLDQFGMLLAAPQERFQLALDRVGTHAPADNTVVIESKLLALIAPPYRSAYSSLTAQLGHARGRDEEFEEWNTRAHLIVDFIAGMTESAASNLLRTLSGLPA
ncbi:MAG TPA: dGTPase, partial [Burkholderiaceae bacterium]|nr:dGTPase [Burkholderiaceae bacterium]